MKDGTGKPRATVGATDGERQSELLDSARATALDVVVEVLAGVHRVKQLRDEGGARRRGDDEDDPPRVSVDAGATAGDLLFDLARLQIGIVQQVLAFQREHRDALLDRLRPPEGLRGSEGAAPLVLRGRVDETRTGTFVVENRSAKKAHVSLRLSSFRAGDGEAPFSAGRILPDAPFDLEPDEERDVAIQLVLDAGHFRAGHRYRAEVEISMAGRPKQRLPVRVEVASAAPAGEDPAP